MWGFYSYRQQVCIYNFPLQFQTDLKGQMNHNISKLPVPPDTMCDSPLGVGEKSRSGVGVRHSVDGCEFLFDLAGEAEPCRWNAQRSFLWHGVGTKFI